MIVVREDLSQRTALSKSTLAQFDLCQTKSWYGLHSPLPFVPNEKVTFGSAVDAGVEVIVQALAKGEAPDLGQASAAAVFCIERDGTEVDILEVQFALAQFVSGVAPHFEWGDAVTQASVTATLDGLGECNGHPDIILGDGRVWDVKTSARTKEVPSLELGFYALLMEAHSGIQVPSVGYMNFVRAKRPYWQVDSAPVTDELRRWTYERSASYVRAKQADDLLNSKTDEPRNFSFPGGPKFDGLCSDCPYSPALGGPCAMTFLREVSDVA